MTYTRTLAHVAATAVLVALAAIVRPHLGVAPAASGLDPDRFWRDKILARGPYAVVIAGDSRAYRGLAPEDLGAAAAVPSDAILNFAFSGTGYGPSYRARLAELVGPGSILLVTLSPASFTPQALAKNGFTSEDERFGGLRDDGFARFKARLEGPLDELDEARALAPFDEKALRALITPPRLRRHVDEDYRATGWVASIGAPVDLHFYDDAFRKGFHTGPVSPAAVDDFLTWLRALAARGVRVYALRLPTSPSLRQIEDTESGLAWPGFVARVSAAGARWLDAPIDRYATYDGSHLMAESAHRLSTEVGRALAADRAR